MGFQHEMAEDLTGNDYTMLTANYKMNDNGSILFSYGTSAHITDSTLDSTGFALGYNHKLSKRTSMYGTYLDKSADTAQASNKDENGFTLGLKHSF